MSLYREYDNLVEFEPQAGFGNPKLSILQPYDNATDC